VIDTRNMIFTEADLSIADDKLKKKLIKVFIDRGITYDKFKELHSDYMVERGIIKLRIINYDRVNVMKSLRLKPTITYTNYTNVMKNILKLNLIRTTDEFMDIDGTPYSVTIVSTTY
jgi:hypothetical protein